MRSLCCVHCVRPSTSRTDWLSVRFRATAAALPKPKQRPSRARKQPTPADTKLAQATGWFRVPPAPPVSLSDAVDTAFDRERDQAVFGLHGVLRTDRPLQVLGATDGIYQWTRAYKAKSVRSVLSTYSQLAKDRLTVLVCITAIGGYAVAVPAAGWTLPAALGVTIGTGLMSASANTFNQLLEIPYDAQMRRTQVRGAVSPLHAAGFGVVSAATGYALLHSLCNPFTAALGLANIGLYSGVYTPLKRVSISCTWVGAVVGAIPPLMGWAACTGALNPAAGTMALILFAWQFPHFNALSWNLRADYSRAGYRVMCVTDPRLCVRTTLRYSYALVALCSLAAPLTGLTSWAFAVDSLPFNAVLCYLSHQFARHPDAQTSRRLFRYTLVYLPMIMLLLIVGAFDAAKPLPPVSQIYRVEADAKSMALRPAADVKTTKTE